MRKPFEQFVEQSLAHVAVPVLLPAAKLYKKNYGKHKEDGWYMIYHDPEITVALAQMAQMDEVLTEIEAKKIDDWFFHEEPINKGRGL